MTALRPPISGITLETRFPSSDRIATGIGAVDGLFRSASKFGAYAGYFQPKQSSFRPK